MLLLGFENYRCGEGGIVGKGVFKLLVDNER